MIKHLNITLLSLLLIGKVCLPQTRPSMFRVLAVAEHGGHHILYSQAAKKWLDKLARDSSFSIDYIQSTDSIDDKFLERYQLFIQLDFPPYAWKDKAVAAFERYISDGKGGWIGFHHATLLGEFDGYRMWQWYSNFMGGIRYVNYIPGFAEAKVHVELKDHPVMKGVSSSFIVKKDEWYIYDKSPRPNVQVIANVDESSYSPASAVKMGDHPVIWSNTNYKSRNVYIFMGHSPDLFDNKNYRMLFSNAIFWAAGR